MNSRRNLKSGQDKKGKLIFAGIGIFILCAIILKGTLVKDAANSDDFCFAEKGTKRIIKIDLSSRLRDDTLKDIKSELHKIFQKDVKPGDQVEFFVMDSNTSEVMSPVVFDNNKSLICKPKSAYSSNLLSNLFENMNYQNSQFDRMTGVVIEKYINNDRSGSKSSPIMNRIKNIITPNRDSKVAMYIFSDFMELSVNVNTYSCSGVDKVRELKFDNLTSGTLYLIPVLNRHSSCRERFISTFFNAENVWTKKHITGEKG